MSSRRINKRLAWEGILCEIPEEWSPAVLSGERRKGFLRVTDLQAIRMEIRWEPFRGKWDPDFVTRKYVRLLEKAARRKRIRIRIGEETIGDAGDAVLIVEEPAAVSYHRLMRMEEGRVVFARVETLPKRDRKLARRVLAGIRSAKRGDRELWEVFGLRFALRLGWTRRDQTLSTGVLRMDFADERNRRRLVLEQQSLGARIMKDRGPEGFLDAVVRSAEIGRAGPPEDFSWMGHEVHAVRGSGRSPVRTRGRWYTRRFRRVFRLRRSAVAATWFCPDSDKVFALTGYGWEDPAGMLEEAGVICHETGGEERR